MPYQAPELRKQRQFLTDLSKTTKSTREIKPLTDLLEIHGPEEAETIAGGIIFEAEKIDIDYKKWLLSPTGGYLYSGSDLYVELNRDGLNNTKDNVLDAETKLIDLLAYYRHRKSLIANDEKAIAKLDKEFQPVVDTLIPQVPNLKSVLTQRPSLTAMLEKLKVQPRLYEEESKERWFDPNINHVKYMQILKIFTHPLMDDLVNSIDTCKTAQDKDQFKYSAIYGALLFIMKQIELEYAGLNVGPPTNSSLYKFCQSVLNIQHSNDIPEVIQINFLVDFANFIERALINPKIIDFLKQCKLQETSYLRFWPTYFTDAEPFLKATWGNLETLLSQESFVWSCTKSLGNYAATTLLAMTCLEIGAGIYVAGLGKGLLPIVMGRFGREFMGGKLGEKVLKMFATQIEPSFLPNVYATAIWYGGKKIKDKIFPPGNPIFKARIASKQFDMELKEEISNTDKEPADILKALIELPSTVISADVKKRVQEIIINPSSSSEKLLITASDEEHQFSDGEEYDDCAVELTTQSPRLG